MKILFYGTKNYDEEFFEKLLPSYPGITIKFTEANIHEETASLAKGYEAICAFVNADLSTPVIEELNAQGVKLILMRCAGYNNVDLETAHKFGMKVLRVPGYSPEAVAEHAMALALTANRHTHKAYIKCRENNFSLSGLNPGQMVIKIVNDELVKLMGSETTDLPLRPGNEITVFMMAGLQGAGKTTTVAKLAGKLKSKGKKPLLVACDVYRPAAITQLQVNGEKQGVEVFSMGDKQKPVDIAKAAIEHAKANQQNVVLIDTAGRLHVDEDMMQELADIKANIQVDATILIVDAMTGQDAVNVASTFADKVGIDGVILTKMDGDTRGGAALSIKAVTGKPILYVGMGEKLSDLEQFYPERMASRILGMGDVMSLIEKAEASIDKEQAQDMQKKLKKMDFDFNDYLTSMEQMNKMGGIGSILNMLPGMGGKMKDIEGMIDEKAMDRTKSIILSMTPQERSNPSILNISRKNRIARGAGVDVSEVNRLVKQFEQSKKMMKQMPGLMGGKAGKRGGGFKLPFGL